MLSSIGRPARWLRSHLGSELTTQLTRSGSAAVLIKLAAAGLQFLMFLILARSMSVADFGRLGFGFSLGTLLAEVGSFGQRVLVLRYAPIYSLEEGQERLLGLIRAGYLIVFSGCGVLGLGVIAAPFVLPKVEISGYLVATGLFTLILGLAEYQASVLRTLGGIALSLVPRDLLWRVGVILCCGPIAIGLAPQISAFVGIGLLAGILMASVVGQASLHPITRSRVLFRCPVIYEWKIWRHAALGMWGTSVVNVAAPNLGVVIVGSLLPPAETGEFFAALRIAALLNIFLMASNLVSAPIISRLHHEGDLVRAQGMSSSVALGASVLALAVLAVFFIGGDHILRVFDPEFGGAKLPLIVMGVGFLINTAAGQNSFIMQMTGHERQFFLICLGCNVGGLVLMFALIPIWGVLGASVSVMICYVSWNVICHFWLLMRLGIDVSVFGLRHMRPHFGR